MLSCGHLSLYIPLAPFVPTGFCELFEAPLPEREIFEILNQCTSANLSDASYTHRDILQTERVRERAQLVSIICPVIDDVSDSHSQTGRAKQKHEKQTNKQHGYEQRALVSQFPEYLFRTLSTPFSGTYRKSCGLQLRPLPMLISLSTHSDSMKEVNRDSIPYSTSTRSR